MTAYRIVTTRRDLTTGQSAVVAVYPPRNEAAFPDRFAAAARLEAMAASVLVDAAGRELPAGTSRIVDDAQTQYMVRAGAR